MSPDVITTRRCSRCKQHLTAEHFSPSVWIKGGYCRACAKSYAAAYVPPPAPFAPLGKMHGPLTRPLAPLGKMHGPSVPGEPMACAWCGAMNAGRRFCGQRCISNFHHTKRSKAEVAAGVAARWKPRKNVTARPSGVPCRYCDGVVSKPGRVQCDECLASKANIRDHRRRYRRARRAASTGTPYTNEQVAELFGWKCQLCGKPISKSAKYSDPDMRARSLSIDHIVPVSLGGVDSIENVQPAHFGCNSSKRNNVRPEGEQLRLCA